MKLFAYLALLGLASTQDISPMGLELDDEEAMNLLDIKMSRWAQRRVERKSEAQYSAWRAIQRGPRNKTEMKEMEDMQKDIFGWTFEEKYDQIKPEQRYGPLVQQIAQSKEFKEDKDFFFGTWTQDPLAKKIMTGAENLKLDLFGGRSRSGRYMRGLQGDELRTRPTPEQSRDLSRFQRDQLDIEGVHIENDDIKDAFEDLEDLNDDIDDFLDPEYAPTAKAIKLDAALRWSPNAQKLMGMIADDFKIHNEKEFNSAIGGVASKIGEKLEDCPLFQRLRKTSERMVRAACRNAQISDLPTGKRMQWVNNLAKDLYEIINSEEPNRGIDRMVGEVLKELMREMGDYFEEVEKIEQSLKPTL